MSPQRYVLSLLMLVATGLPLAAPAALAHEDKEDKRTISLTATGAVKTTPDKVDISTGVTTQAPTARQALDQNTAAMTKVVDALKSEGILPKDIQTTDFSVMPVYDQRKENRAPVVIGYRVTNSVHIIVRNTARLGDILDKVVSLGANEIGAISFGVSEPEELKDEARKQAMRNALANAELYAAAAGVALGPVLTITEEESTFQPRYAAGAAPMEMSKPAPIEAGTATVEVRLNVTWELK